MNLPLFKTLYLTCILAILSISHLQINGQNVRSLASGGEIIIIIEDIWTTASNQNGFGAIHKEKVSDDHNCLALSPSIFSDRLEVGVCSGTIVHSIVFSDSEGRVWLESSVNSLPASFTVQSVPDGEYLVELNTSEGYVSDWATKDED